MNNYKTHLVSRTVVAKNIEIMRFRLDENQELSFEAGQYLILVVPREGTYPLRRMYSILSAQGNEFEMLVEFIDGGIGSRYLQSTKSGDQILFDGPAGVFTLRQTESQNIVFLATGTGIAPIICMIENALQKKEIKAMKLFFGMKTFEDVYLLEKLKKIREDHPTFSFTVCLSRENTLDVVPETYRPFFIQGRVTAEVDRLDLGFMKSSDFYVCGGQETVESLRAYLAEKGIAKEHIFFERFT